LLSLLAQTRPPAEILVVDNAPQNKKTQRLIETGFPKVRYVKEPKPGLDAARNRALRMATQDIVAFLDDDAVAEAGWSGALLARFERDGRLGACTGRVEPLSLAEAGQRIVEANGGYSRGLQAVQLPQDAGGRLYGVRAPLIAWAVSIGSGCSMAVRRDVALAIGGFDEALGDRNLPGGDDHDMLWRLLTSGCGVYYEPAALAWHEHRHGADAAYDQIVGHQRGLVAFLTKATFFGSLSQRGGVLAFLAWRLVKPALRLVRGVFGRDPLPARVLLRMCWNCWRGLIAYPFARMRGTA
jgi:GT2 family glycosyltransferase